MLQTQPPSEGVMYARRKASSESGIHDATGTIGHTENTYEQVLISTLQVRISELEAALEAAHQDPEFMGQASGGAAFKERDG